MATLNTILSISESVGIEDQRFIGQMMSRNQRIATSEIIGVQPFGFDMKPMNYLLYSQNRPLLSTLRAADREFEQYLNFGSTGWVNYIAYQGDMSSAEIAACQYQITSANKTIVLGSLPTMGATEFIVKTGDFLQIDRYAYIATANVQRGSGSTVNIPVHRTIMTTLANPMFAVIGQYGTTQSIGGSTFIGVTFPVILQQYPNYTLIPMTNDSFIQWSGSFKAIEAVL
jgi:hypothetical protein